MLWGAWSWRMSLGWFANPILAAVLIAAVVQCLASMLHHTVGEPARRLIRSSVRRTSHPSQTYAVGAS
jgi:peptidoglycan/LPS O-acetylase OafA/YrhL